MTDIAERAASCADVAHDHEGGRAVAETFADVRTGGFFANGVQMVVTQNLFQMLHRRVRRRLGADPMRFARDLRTRFDLDGNTRDFIRTAQQDTGFGFVFG